MYFKNFNNIFYNFRIKGKDTIFNVKDITQNVRFRKEVLESISLYDEYYITDTDTPEIISERVYGTPEYHWVVMIFNEKYDYKNDFPVSDVVLQQNIDLKYKDEADNVIYYVNEENQIRYQSSFDKDDNDNYITPAGFVPITNRRHEEILNDEKKVIKLPAPSTITTIITQLQDLV